MKAKVSSVLAGNDRTKSPTFITTALSRNDVRPVTSTQPASRSARITLVGQEPDALVDTGRGGDRGHGDRQDRQRRLRSGPDTDAEDHVEPDVEEDHTDAEAGRHAEDRAQHGGGVDGVAEGAVDALAEDRVQRGADGEREVLAVGEVAEREAHQGVHRPAGDAVVEEGPHRRVARRVDGAGLPTGGAVYCETGSMTE